jgi:hypothetical protein
MKISRMGHQRLSSKAKTTIMGRKPFHLVLGAIRLPRKI